MHVSDPVLTVLAVILVGVLFAFLVRYPPHRF
jgi:hypothetical protein